MKRKNGINNFSILIVDDHEIIHRGLKGLISAFWRGIEIICLSTIEQVLIAREQVPKLIIIDVDLPGGSRQKIIHQIKSVHLDAKVLVFSSLNEEIYAIPLLKAGASGFLSKTANESEIVTAITAVLSGGRYLSHNIRENMLNKIFDNDTQNPFIALSSRELEVAGLLKQGIGILEISSQLNLQMGTISTYKMRIFQKLNVKSIIALAEKMGFNETINLGEINNEQ